MKQRILVTGGAGFIGSHLVDSLLSDGHEVIVIDNFDSFYDRSIKEGNISNHKAHSNYTLLEEDIRNRNSILNIFEEVKPEIVVHLAAKAGVRPSVDDPQAYIEVNVNGTANLLEASVKYGIKKFLFASSSSVYGLNEKVPFSEEDPLLVPASPYAATKIAGEALCQSYNNCYGLRVIALRFFTVYGPRQRPDLAIHKFTRRIIKGEKIYLYGDGSSSRDYTYISDIISGVRKAMATPFEKYRVYNLGNNTPTRLNELVSEIENANQKKALIMHESEQVGDVPTTWADLKRANEELGYVPGVMLRDGLQEFVRWISNGHRNKLQ